MRNYIRLAVLDMKGLVDEDMMTKRVERIDRLKDALIKNGMREFENLVFTGVDCNRSRLKQILTYGIRYRKKKKKPQRTTRAQSMEEMENLHETHRGWCSAIDYAMDDPKRALLVYDKNELSTVAIDPHGGFEYAAKEGGTFREALVAILFMKNNTELDEGES